MSKFLNVILISLFLLPCCGKDDKRGGGPTVAPVNRDTLRIEKTVNGTKIVVMQANIVRLKFDPTENAAIVNAANTGLTHGGGICGVIYKAAGSRLDAYTDNYKKDQSVKCPTGQAVITDAFDLSKVPHNIMHIIHAVGPIGENPSELESAYTESLKVAQDNSVRSIAFPGISTGIYGYSVDKAAPIAFQAVIKYVNNNPNTFKQIIFVCFKGKPEEYSVYKSLINSLH